MAWDGQIPMTVGKDGKAEDGSQQELRRSMKVALATGCSESQALEMISTLV